MKASINRVRNLIAVVVTVGLLTPSIHAGSDNANDQRFISEATLTKQGFKPLFNGKGLGKWDVKTWHEGHWVARGDIIHYDGKAEHKNNRKNTLWSKESFGDCIVYVEWRLPSKPKMKPHPIVLPNGDFLRDEKGRRKTTPKLDAGDSGLYFRGDPKCQANIWSQTLGSGEINGYRVNRKLPDEIRKACLPTKRADRPFGEWNWFKVTLKGDRMTVVLNGETVIDKAKLPGLPDKGPIALQHHGDPVEFRKIYVKTLGSGDQ